MRHRKFTWKDYLIPAWMILISVFMLQASLMHVRRVRAMGVLGDHVSRLRGQLRASETIIWHIHGPQAAVEADFRDNEERE